MPIDAKAYEATAGTFAGEEFHSIAACGSAVMKASACLLMCAGLLAAPAQAAAVSEETDAADLQADEADGVWVDGALNESLIARLAERERLGDTSGIVRSSSFGVTSDLMTGEGETAAATSHERPLMGTFALPMVGRVSMVSQEISADGGVDGVKFFSVDNPGSKWDVDVDVDDGAVFEFTRKWGTKSPKTPFKARDKAKVNLLAGN